MNARATEHTFDVERAASWLSSGVVAEDGSVLSWVDDETPGYPYPEAAGLWLAAACASTPLFAARPEMIDRCAARLAAEVDAHGAVGRADILYSFDSAVALRGLCAYATHFKNSAYDDQMQCLYAFVRDTLGKGTARVPSSDESRWSNSDRPHQMKTVVGLCAWATLSGDPEPRKVAGAVVTSHREQRAGGGFLSDGEESGVYMHASLYAAEGMHFWQQTNGKAAEDTDLGAWLARQQRSDGGLPAWADNSDADCHADATAQAIRIWCLQSSAIWAPQIEAALGWLGSQQCASGAISYSDRCGHQNSWATLFAVQAAHWACAGPTLSDIL